MRNFALFSAATWRIRHAGRQTWAEVKEKSEYGRVGALNDTWPCGGCKCVEHPSEN